ncbi:MAG TPA: tRNA (adenosine(37)-N6)-dimethylallyltransferase MiaA [Candidatus Acidoferrales bacterium]|nr:tRNA (adenosine(37)-N6)-dimethylallyltransferase MiaA [Candidatus Acidoferrales bacterium]
MTGENTQPLPLVVILGPTASGKSALAIDVAQRWGGEVLCCDSTQVYRHFDIGTSKIRGAEQRGVAHHLIDILEPDEIFTAGDYRRRALAVLADLRSRGRLPVLTAGTGLYLRALLEGLADAPTRSEELRERLRSRARKRGPEYVHRILARLDPQTAARIGVRDAPKTIRAVEVCLAAGRPMSEVLRQPQPPLAGYQPIKIGLAPPRAALYQRIERRTQAMLDAGWLDEVRALVARGLPAGAKPFQFIGYSELRAHLAGEVDLKSAVRAIQQATRRYAKRQVTWFRREKEVEWFPGFGDSPDIAEMVFTALDSNLDRPAA